MVTPWRCRDYAESKGDRKNLFLLRLGKIFHREKFPAPFDDPNSNGIHIGIQDVGAMVRGPYKLSLNGLHARTLSHVFRQPDKPCSRLRNSRRQARLACEPMFRRPRSEEHTS